MADPIPSSLSQLINPQLQAQSRPAQAQPAATSFSDVMAAQKAFFQQVTQPKITPATYTAADIARAMPTPAPAPAPAADDTQPYKRPGSYLNIVI